MDAQERADGVVAGVARLPVRLAREVRDEIVSIEKEAEAMARGHGGAAGRGRSGLRGVSWAWFAGLAGVAALRMVQPETALLLAAAHLVERHVHNQAVDEFVGGLGEGI